MKNQINIIVLNQIKLKTVLGKNKKKKNTIMFSLNDNGFMLHAICKAQMKMLPRNRDSVWSCSK